MCTYKITHCSWKGRSHWVIDLLCWSKKTMPIFSFIQIPKFFWEYYFLGQNFQGYQVWWRIAVILAFGRQRNLSLVWVAWTYCVSLIQNRIDLYPKDVSKLYHVRQKNQKQKRCACVADHGDRYIGTPRMNVHKWRGCLRQTWEDKNCSTEGRQVMSVKNTAKQMWPAEKEETQFRGRLTESRMEETWVKSKGNFVKLLHILSLIGHGPGICVFDNAVARNAQLL